MARSGATVRIGERSREILRELAGRSGEPMRAILDKAIESYRRHRFLEETNAAYVALRADSQAWQEELEERAAWDTTAADGLEDE